MYNKTLLAMLCAASFSSQANVLITEYVEGGGFNKAIEISNLGSENVDLATLNYKLSLYVNGGDSVQATMMLEGLLVPNSSIVVYNESAADEFKPAAPVGLSGSAVTSFNGDDTIVLSNDNGIVDVFGQYGEDPGSYFGSSDDNTKDHSVRRMVSVTEGDTGYADAFDPSVEWVFLAKDTSDGLGCASETACAGDEPQAQTGTAAGADDGVGAIEAIGGGGGDDGGSDGGDDGGSDGGSDGGDDSSICFNCPDLSKIKDRNTDYVHDTYYANALAADTSDAAALRSAIQQDISAEHKQLSYSEVWTALTYTDEDPDNSDNVILLYKGNSIAKSSNGSGSQSSNPDNWNREHVWAKSHGFPSSSQLGYTDIHHLRPSDISVNSDRSDHDFENGGEANSEAPDNFEGTDTWEPRTAVKGDVARMMLYMDVRYAAGSDSNMPDLVLVQSVDTDYADGDDAEANFGNLCTLLEWHETDPVDDFETNRNHSIYEFQGNRNPFIDHPEWVDLVFAGACNSAPSVDAGEAQIVDEMAQVTLTATASDSDGTVASYAWSQTSGTSVALSSADTAQMSFTAPEVDSAEVLTFSLTVTDNHAATATDTVTVTVNPANVAPSATLVESMDVEANASVELSVTATDSDGTIASYAWTQTSGFSVELSNSDTATASFEAPELTEDTSLVFEVVVTDNRGGTATRAVTVTVKAPDEEAVVVTEVEVQEEETVTLSSATAQKMTDVVSFEWSQVSGAAVTLNDADTANASFAAPVLTSDDTLVFELKMVDSKGNEAKTQVQVKLKANNQAPVVTTSDVTAQQGETVSLTATASDEDGSIASYSWTQISGPVDVEITNADQAVASITIPSVERDSLFVFEVTVTDNQGATSTQTQRVIVNLPQEDSSGGSLGWMFAAAAGLLFRRKR